MQMLILAGTLIIPTGALMLMDLAYRRFGKQPIPVLERGSGRRSGHLGKMRALE